MLTDAARRLVEATPYYVPIVGPPGSTAAVTAAGALQGWNGVVSPGGSFDRANAVLAQRLAQRRSPAELLEDLEDFATGMSAPRGLGRIFPRRLLLGDHVIHELDIRFALGLDSTVGPAQLAAVLDSQVQIPNPFIPSRAWARGLSLRAEDLRWSHGDGPSVTGNAAHLASVLAGRPWALRHLHGDGVDVLRDRLAG